MKCLFSIIWHEFSNVKGPHQWTSMFKLKSFNCKCVVDIRFSFLDLVLCIFFKTFRDGENGEVYAVVPENIHDLLWKAPRILHSILSTFYHQHIPVNPCERFLKPSSFSTSDYQIFFCFLFPSTSWPQKNICNEGICGSCLSVFLFF